MLKRLVCPLCKSELERKAKSFFCQRCSINYPCYQASEDFIVDFKMLNENTCYCNRDGKIEETINLQEIIKEKDRNNNLTQRATEATRKAQIIKEEVGKNHKVLDVGCAGGPYANLICKENEVYGVDECPIRLLLDEDNALSKGYTLLCIRDGLQLPFADSFFDIVLCTEVLEHTLETRAFVKELYRVLKTNGKLIISVPNLVSLSNRIGILFGKGLQFNLFWFKDRCFYKLTPWPMGIPEFKYDFGGIRYPEQPLHIRFFTFESLREFLKQMGFKVEKEIGISFVSDRFEKFLYKTFKNYADDLLVIASKQNSNAIRREFR